MYEGTLNFGGICLRVAEAVNIAKIGTAPDNRFVLPTDPNRLDRLKRCVNDAARQFTTSTRHPLDKTVRRWTFMAPRIEVLFQADGVGPFQPDGDPSRCMLPPGVCSAPLGKISWKNADGTVGGGEVFNCAHDRLEALRASGSTVKGPPLYGTLKLCIVPKFGNRPGYELNVYPAPDRNIIVGTRYRVQAVEMIDFAERGIWPGVHDDTVIAFAIYNWKRLEGADDAAAAMMHRDQLLIASFDLDALNNPTALGQLPGSGDSLCPHERTPLWNVVSGQFLIT